MKWFLVITLLAVSYVAVSSKSLKEDETKLYRVARDDEQGSNEEADEASDQGETASNEAETASGQAETASEVEETDEDADEDDGESSKIAARELKCSKGRYAKTETFEDGSLKSLECLSCPSGTFSKKSDLATSCSSCPEGYGTPEGEQSNKCEALCAVGEGWTKKRNGRSMCDVCEKGSYSDGLGFECSQCPLFYSTNTDKKEGATSSENCVFDGCPDGFGSTEDGLSCQPCGFGSYSDGKKDERSCASCCNDKSQNCQKKWTLSNAVDNKAQCFVTKKNEKVSYEFLVNALSGVYELMLSDELNAAVETSANSEKDNDQEQGTVNSNGKKQGDLTLPGNTAGASSDNAGKKEKDKEAKTVEYTLKDYLCRSGVDLTEMKQHYDVCKTATVTVGKGNRKTDEVLIPYLVTNKMEEMRLQEVFESGESLTCGAEAASSCLSGSQPLSSAQQSSASGEEDASEEDAEEPSPSADQEEDVDEENDEGSVDGENEDGDTNSKTKGNGDDQGEDEQ